MYFNTVCTVQIACSDISGRNIKKTPIRLKLFGAGRYNYYMFQAKPKQAYSG